MRWTSEQLRDYEMRRSRRHLLDVSGLKVSKPAPEQQLHRDIMAWCDAQWPRWKYLHARMDRESTIAVGAQDFTLFAPCGRVLCIECKRSGGKLDASQAAWRAEMAMLGHIVHVVLSFEEFMALAGPCLSNPQH